MIQTSASNRKAIREAEKEYERQVQDRANFLIGAMSIPQGRAYFHDLLTFTQAFVNAPTYTTNQDYHALGTRNVGLRIFAEIMTHCPDSFTTMMKEANARDQFASARQRNVSPGSGRDDLGSEPDSTDEDGSYAEPELGLFDE